MSKLALLCLLSVGLVSVLACAGRAWWLLDLFSHFRVQYLWLLVLSTLSLLAFRHWRWAAGGTLMLSFNLYFVVPLYLGSAAPLDAEQAQLDIVVFNVNSDNLRRDAIGQYLAKQGADVIVVIEATKSMQDTLTAALPSYDLVAEPREDSFGMLLYSRLPLQSQRVLYLGDSALPAIDIRISKAGTQFSVLAVHTMPPVSATNSTIRDRMLVDAAKWASTATNALVVGDLNATPWSHAFSRLLEEGALVNSQRGFGVQSTWPGALWLLSIPIDHGVHGRGLTTVSRSVGPFLGSDHRPLRLRVGVRLDARAPPG